MRDFPFFTTDYGVSSLILKEIPYRSEAYIRLLDVPEDFFQEHLAECISFCRMCGAERIYAEGSAKLEEFPLYTAVNRMQGTVPSEPERTASLFPVTQETVGHWRSVYNEAMRGVDNAGTLEARDEKRIVASGGAYFVHDKGELLGIFWLEDNKLLAVAATRRGAGERVMHTMLSLLDGEMVWLEVASTNKRAIRLYERLGLVTSSETARWYCVFGIAGDNLTTQS